MSVSVQEGMQQQLFDLTGEIVDLNEYLNVNYLGQHYTSDCRGHCFSGVQALGLSWGYVLHISPLGQGLLRTGLELSWRQAAQHGAGCSPLTLAEKGSWSSKVRGFSDRTGLHIHCLPRMHDAWLLLSVFRRFQGLFCSQEANRYSQTLTRIYF